MSSEVDLYKLVEVHFTYPFIWVLNPFLLPFLFPLFSFILTIIIVLFLSLFLKCAMFWVQIRLGYDDMALSWISINFKLTKPNQALNPNQLGSTTWICCLHWILLGHVMSPTKYPPFFDQKNNILLSAGPFLDMSLVWLMVFLHAIKLQMFNLDCSLLYFRCLMLHGMLAYQLQVRMLFLATIEKVITRYWKMQSP